MSIQIATLIPFPKAFRQPPVAVPLDADPAPALAALASDLEARRIAGFVLRLEEAAAPSLVLTTLAARTLGGGVVGYVLAHLPDGARERFTIAEARTAAAALRDAAGLVRQLEAWAQALEDAAACAERQADAMTLNDGDGRGVRQPGFGA